MKFLRRLIQIDEHQEISDSGYDRVNNLIYPQTLLKYLNSSCICMPKTCAHTKQVLGQPELRVSVQITCKSICMLNGKSALSRLQGRGTEAAFLTPKSSTFFPSSPTQSQSLIFTPANFLQLLCHTSSTFCYLCNWLPHSYSIMSARNQQDTSSSQKKLGTGGISRTKPLKVYHSYYKPSNLEYHLSLFKPLISCYDKRY